MGLMKPLGKEEIPEEFWKLIDWDKQWSQKNDRGKSAAYVQSQCPECEEWRPVLINAIRNWARGIRPGHFPTTHRACRFTLETIDNNGYVRVYVGYDKENDHTIYKLKHRHVMEQKLGRPLESHETVHHIDGNKLNNDPSNLQLRQGRHGKGVVHQCLDCQSFNVAAVELS